MIQLSLRRNFDGRVRFADSIRARLGDGMEISLERVAEKVRFRRVLLMIHGYHNSVSDTMDSYGTLEATLRDGGFIDESGKTQGAYEVVIGLLWPGSWAVLGFWLAWLRAEKAGRMLADLMSSWNANELDIETHSLGARVALAALNTPRSGKIRNLILTAPAVNHRALSVLEGRFTEATLCAKQVLVCHSKHDRVLKYMFRYSMWQKALGLDGPAGRCARSVRAIDCSPDVTEHGGYKRSAVLFNAWGEMIGGRR